MFILFCSVSCNNTGKKVIAGAYNRKCSVFKSIPPIVEGKKEIIFLGHSLINEFLINEYLSPGDSLRLINMGIGGDDTRGVYYRRHIAFDRKPKAIFMEVGINDLHNSEPNDTILYYYNLILRDARDMGIKVYLSNIFPSKLSLSNDIKYINNKLKEMCLLYNHQYIDVYSVFQYDDSLDPVYDCGDHVHLSGRGYIKWAEIIKPYL